MRKLENFEIIFCESNPAGELFANSNSFGVACAFVIFALKVRINLRKILNIVSA